jgi:hypothetical protein
MFLAAPRDASYPPARGFFLDVALAFHVSLFVFSREINPTKP